jgi:hypothetical protein
MLEPCLSTNGVWYKLNRYMAAVGIPSTAPPSGVRIGEAPPTLTPLSKLFLIAHSKIAKDNAMNTKESKKTKTI